MKKDKSLKLSKYKSKQRLKDLFLKLSDSCKTDNLRKFEYALSEVYKITFMNHKVMNFANASSNKITDYVLSLITIHNPKQISEKYKSEFEQLHDSLDEMKSAFKEVSDDEQK